MTGRSCKSVFIIPLLLLIATATEAGDVLVKIGLDDLNRLPEVIVENCVFRFQGNSFLLAQGDEKLFSPASPFYTVLDRVDPSSCYYLVRAGRYTEILQELGSILFRFGDSVLLRINPSDEPRLISLGLPLTPLPDRIKLGIYKERACPLKLQLETAVSADVIRDIINAVSTDKIRQTVFELQENRDLNRPSVAYRSRYCLRVKETDDPSDPACDNAGEYIFNRFREYGLEVRYDDFEHEVLTQGHYRMRNVVADLPGKGVNSHRVFVISAHYDSIASKSTNWLINWKSMPAPGADDNASGVSAVIESARILSQYEFDSTIRFIAFSGEELGLHGSKHYAKLSAERGEEIVGVINLDMIAYDPDLPDIDIIANPASEWLASALLSVQERYNIGKVFLRKIVNAEMVYSDHSPFWQNGYSAILGIDNSDFESPEFYPFMHTAEDTIDKLDFEMATNMVQIALATLASLAGLREGSLYPDLAVNEGDIRLSENVPTRGQPFHLIAQIRNLGKVPARSTRVQVWLEEPFAKAPRLIADEVVDISAEGYAEVSALLNLTEWGDYKVLVKANPDYRTFETDGRNNVAGKIIHIGSSSLALGKLMLYPNPVVDGRTNVAYTLSKDASARMEIYNAKGELVYQKHFVNGSAGGKFGYNQDIWNGENMSGEKVASGVYFCHIIAEDEQGNIKVARSKLFVIR